MKKILFLFLFAFGGIYLFSQNIRLAVIGFTDKTHRVRPQIVSTLVDLTTTYLFRMNHFVLIEREAIDKILREQKLALSGLLDKDTSTKVGKLLGANYLLLGSIVNFGDSTQENNWGTAAPGASSSSGKKLSFGGIKVEKLHAYARLVLRIVEVETGKIVFSSSGEASYKKTNYNLLLLYDDNPYAIGKVIDDNTLGVKILDEALKKALEPLYFYPFRKEPLQARVIGLKENRLLVSAGRNLGLKKGDKFFLLGKEEKILDPITGEDVGSERSKILSFPLALTEVKQGYSTAILTGESLLKVKKYFSTVDFTDSSQIPQASFLLSSADKFYNEIVNNYLNFKLKKTVYLIKKFLRRYPSQKSYVFYYWMASSFERGGACHAALKYYQKVRELLFDYPLPSLDKKISLLKKKCH